MNRPLQDTPLPLGALLIRLEILHSTVHEQLVRRRHLAGSAEERALLDALVDAESGLCAMLMGLEKDHTEAFDLPIEHAGLLARHLECRRELGSCDQAAKQLRRSYRGLRDRLVDLCLSCATRDARVVLEAIANRYDAASQAVGRAAASL